MTFAVHNEDCLTGMANLAENSIDAIVTDPPYGLSFMGKDWDHGIPGVHFWQEALRIAKPGAHLLAFGSTRTFHRLTCAIEDAGWEIRDCLMWVYGSGFPKSLDVSKAIDKAAGAEREVVGPRVYAEGHIQNTTCGEPPIGTFKQKPGTIMESLPATDAARQWSGWGTALKPAWEPIILARKPLEGTVAENVLKHGTGALNIDGCRVGTEGGTAKGSKPQGAGNGIYGAGLHGACDIKRLDAGRWPANLIHDGSDEVVAGFPNSTSNGGLKPSKAGMIYANGNGIPPTDYFNYGDTGSAARFFYCAKASKRDRDDGVAGGMRGRQDGSMGSVTMRKNHHPTVKPTDLMRYLCRLITPPNGLILDPFTGSGSTGKAALLEGFRFIGFELEAEYAAIARARCAGVLGKQPLLEAV